MVTKCDQMILTLKPIYLEKTLRKTLFDCISFFWDHKEALCSM